MSKKDFTKIRPQSSKKTASAKTSEGHSSKRRKQMSANLKTSALGTSKQKKSHSLSLVKSPDKGKGSTRPRYNKQLQALLDRFQIKVTAADRLTARRLDALYHDKRTPPVINHTIFQIFQDLHKLYEITLPKNFVSKWIPFWEVLSACNRFQGHLAESIEYTWQHTDDEGEEMIEEEKAEAALRAIFDFIHDRRIPEQYRGRAADAVIEMLDSFHPFNNFDIFRIAWPLAVAKVEQEEEADENAPEPQEVILRRELTKDAEALARIINSDRTPAPLRNAMLDEIAGIQSGVDDEPDVLKVSYPLAILRGLKEDAEDASDA